MEDVKSWVDYYNKKATYSDNPLEVSDMHLGNAVANQLFLLAEEKRMRAFLQPGKNRGTGNHLLDLGCSAGTCTGLMEKYFDSVTGVDLASNTIEIAKKHLPSCTFIVDDITTLTKVETDSHFTHVLSYGVIHYLSKENLVHFFSALRRITRTGTRIAICRIPNKDHYQDYQEFRQSREISRKLFVKDQLQWTWVSEDFVRGQVEADFEFIPIFPLLQLDFPLKAFFDFVLIRK
jgi:cyclopropane fatty-acyl-phospholipid synthase-like methyltransferase